MTRVALAFLSLAAGTSLLAAAQNSEAGTPSPVLVNHGGPVAGSIVRAVAAGTVSLPLPAEIDEHEIIRRRLLDSQEGTYIADILLERDSALTRWPDRLGV